MTQPYLFDAAPLAPYSGRTPTARACSKAASLQAGKFGGSQRERMVAAYEQAGARGLTDPEMEARTGISRQSICQRRAALMCGKVVVDSGRSRASLGHGPCTIYVLTEQR